MRWSMCKCGHEWWAQTDEAVTCPACERPCYFDSDFAAAPGCPQCKGTGTRFYSDGGHDICTCVLVREGLA